MKHRKIILLINFIFYPTFFLIASYQILKNYAILINHESFFQRKDFPQLHRFWFLKINSLIAETIKKTFSIRNFYKQIAEFDNNLFIFENWTYQGKNKKKLEIKLICYKKLRRITQEYKKNLNEIYAKWRTQPCIYYIQIFNLKIYKGSGIVKKKPKPF